MEKVGRVTSKLKDLVEVQIKSTRSVEASKMWSARHMHSNRRQNQAFFKFWREKAGRYHFEKWAGKL